MIVWVVLYGDEIAAIYSNESAARAHAASADGYDVTDWTVLDEYERTDPSTRRAPGCQ